MMASRRVSRRGLRSACADVGPGDGIDPRLDGRDPSGPVANRKALQLSGQVARTLSGLLAESEDDVLRDLLVVSVVPAPYASRLLVTVAPSPAAEAAEAAAVLARLERVRGRLRTEVAAAVHRRKAPDLTFRVVNDRR
jgi:ribosome-binding factor A